LFGKIIIVFISLVSTFISAKPISMLIDSTEGGMVSERHLSRLQNYLKTNKCQLDSVVYGNNGNIGFEHAFIFSPLEKKVPSNYRKILSIKTLNDQPLSASILVRNSTGIDDLKSLNNVHIAFLSEKSKLGYKQPKTLLNSQGARFHKDRITFTQSNVGAVSLLMHKDVFAAVIATPLAKKWASMNELKIVSQTAEIKAGGIWVDKSVDDLLIQSCQKALKNLDRTSRKKKKTFDVFPLWINKFEIDIRTND